MIRILSLPQTISDFILQYQSEDDIHEDSDNEDPEDIVPSSAEGGGSQARIFRGHGFIKNLDFSWIK